MSLAEMNQPQRGRGPWAGVGGSHPPCPAAGVARARRTHGSDRICCQRVWPGRPRPSSGGWGARAHGERSSANATVNKPVRPTLRSQRMRPCECASMEWRGIDRQSTPSSASFLRIVGELRVVWGGKGGGRGPSGRRPTPNPPPSRVGTNGAFQSHGYCRARGEILGPRQEHPMRRRMAGERSSIKNESEGIQDDQIPLSSSTVNGAGKVLALPSSLDGLRECPLDSLPTSNP